MLEAIHANKQYTKSYPHKTHLITTRPLSRASPRPLAGGRHVQRQSAADIPETYATAEQDTDHPDARLNHLEPA